MSANATGRFILPLCSADEVRAELADTERSLARLGDFKVVDAGRRAERRERLIRWRDRLREQLDAMEVLDAA